MNGSITILSCGPGLKNLPALQDEIFAGIEVLAGGRALLSALAAFAGEKVVLAADSAKAVATLCQLAARGRRILVLASGDALFHGIGGTFARLPAERRRDFALRIIPGPTAFQGLFAFLQKPWEAARFFSLHQGGALPAREIISARLAVVYGGGRRNAARLAAELLEIFPEQERRPAVLAENLGLAGERIVSSNLAAIAALACGPLSFLVLLEDEAGTERPFLALGLEDAFFAPENGLITHPEIRAAALAKLRLPPSGVLWDIGAGSGSVGLEAAGLRPEMRVFGLEKKAERVARIRTTMQKLGLANYGISLGSAPAGMKLLPPPARIFIGGGGEQLPLIMEQAFAALVSGGRMVVAAVTMEALQQLIAWRPEACREAVQIAVSRLTGLAGRYRFMKSDNPVYLFVFVKEIGL
ncbi:MAG TPA: precorrin-6Y C5,15-methyltransferase (decarboxylating) subunit CbiT [Proteobacteria bacterium]|nr:precorrin-6Y C5,15-methyltransferase (decarboxylating) subunit CbiT [Pseudomonadota bacterium]